MNLLPTPQSPQPPQPPPQPPSQPPSFPATEIEWHAGGVATFTMTAKNHYRHRVTVPEEALAFLKKLWETAPFKVSSGGKAKKLVIASGPFEGVFVHDLWLAAKGVDTHARKSHCKNHDWLDWTNDNVYVPTETKTGKSIAESEQKRFNWMSRPGQISNVPPEGMQSSPLELIDARKRGVEQARSNARRYADPVFEAKHVNPKTGEDEGIAWAFADAANMPTQWCRPEVISWNDEEGSDEVLISPSSQIAVAPRPRTHAPAGWEYKERPIKLGPAGLDPMPFD